MLQFFVIDFPLVFGEERAGRADISRKVGGWGLSWPLSHQPLSPQSLQSNPHFKHSFYILHIDLDYVYTIANMMVMSKFLEKEKFWSAKEENCGEREGK